MSTLVTVNGTAISLQDALRRGILHDEEFLQNTVDLELLRHYAEQHGIRNSDQELQVAVDELRYQHGLEAMDKVQQWLKNRHLTPLSVQNAVDGMLLRNKVRNAIPAQDVAAYFAEHQLDFDRVDLYSIRLNDAETARELYAQMTEEEANFHVLAMEHSLDEETKHLGGYVGRLSRQEMTGEVEAAVFQAKPGDVIGPIKTEKGYNLFKVAKVHKASLEQEKDNIQFQLFEELLTRLRAEAKVLYPALEEA